LTSLLLTNVTQGSLSLNANGSFTYTPPINYFGVVSFTYRASDGYPVMLEQHNFGGATLQIGDGTKGAQSFRHGTAGGASYMINQVVLYLSRRSGASGNLNFSIGTGVNTGATAGSSQSISASSITNTSQGVSFQMYVIAYSAPVGPFTAGTTYYLNLNNSSGDKIFVEYPGFNDTYPNGTFYINGNNQNKDMRFQIYETIPSDPAAVTINILPVEDPPTVGNDSTNTLEDTSVTINVLANDYDPEGAPLTIIGTSTTNGMAVISGADVIFSPAPNFNGTAVFSYTVSDGGLSSTGWVTVTVIGVDDAPIANNDSTNTLEDESVTIPVLANDSDVEGTPLTITGTSSTSGTAVISGTDIVFTPAANFNGTAVFSYTISDGTNSATASVTVTVAPVNDAPLASDDTYTTPAATTLTVPVVGLLANDTDVDGNALTALLVSDVSHGSLSLNPDGSFTYTPTSNFFGGDSFAYRASDGLAAGNVATVTINVTPADPFKILSGQMTPQGFTLQISVPAGSTYVILTSTDLQDWTPIFTNVAPTGSVVVTEVATTANALFTDAEAINQSKRFYRAMVR
jgi:VCBS repeat-containing protein